MYLRFINLCCFLYKIKYICIFIKVRFKIKDKHWRSQLKNWNTCTCSLWVQFYFTCYRFNHCHWNYVTITGVYELPVSFNKDIDLEPHCNDHSISCWSIMTNQRINYTLISAYIRFIFHKVLCLTYFTGHGTLLDSVWSVRDVTSTRRLSERGR